MRHLEYTSPPWNTSPTKDATFFESAVAVLKSSLGKHWIGTVLVLLSVLLAPVIIFRSLGKIEFEAAEFVTEWLKITVEGVLFFFILEIVRHRSLSSAARTRMFVFVTTNYLGSLNALLKSLAEFSEALTKNLPTEQSLIDARQKWSILEHALSDEALYHLPQEEMVSLLWAWRGELDLNRCTNILSSLSKVRNIQNLNEAEFEELTKRLRLFLTRINTYYTITDSGNTT